MQVDLETVNTAVKSGMPILKAATSATGQTGQDFEWLDRIAKILDSVTQFAKVYQNQRQGGQGGQGTQDVIERQPPNGYIEQRLAPQVAERPIQPDNTDKEKQMQLIKLFIPIFDAYIDKCIAENPKMSIGEAISKLDIINITDAKQMLTQYKLSNGIK